MSGNDWLNDYPVAPVAPRAAAPAAAPAAGNDWLNEFPVAPKAAKVKQPAQPEPTYDPTEGMSTFEKGAAGAGKALYDMGRGVGQLFGLVSDEDVAESRKRDAALMNTGAGVAGNIVGNIAPTLLGPAAAGVKGAAAVGSALGFLQPTVNNTETVQNTLLGGALGGAGVAIGRGVKGLYQGGKALIEPFTESGRNMITGRVIQRFADRPDSVATATGRPSITGAVPTLAEETRDAGLARLQDALRSADPQIAGRIDERLVGNNAARVAALERLSGANGARDAAVKLRADTTKPLYDAATSLGIDPNTLSPQQLGEVSKLMSMPAVQKAMVSARQNASNFGMDQGAEGSVAGLHQAKMAMDDRLREMATQGLGETNEAQAVRAAKDRLVTFIDSMSGGAYGDARKQFATMSKPINQMDIANELLTRGVASTTDLSGTPRLMPNALTSMLKTPEAEATLIRRATGGKAGSNKLSEILSPDQERMIRAVVSESDRAAAVARAGSGPGSPTAQRLASQNVLSQLMGPMGAPASWSESVLAQTVAGKPLNMIYGGVAEPRIQQALADAVLDPAKARAALEAIRSQGIQVPAGIRRQLIETAARNAPASIAVSQPRGD